jgi:hypothetical protein
VAIQVKGEPRAAERSLFFDQPGTKSQKPSSDDNNLVQSCPGSCGMCFDAQLLPGRCARRVTNRVVDLPKKVVRCFTSPYISRIYSSQLFQVFRKQFNFGAYVQEILRAVLMIPLIMNEKSLCKKARGVRNLYRSLGHERISALVTLFNLRGENHQNFDISEQ